VVTAGIVVGFGWIMPARTVRGTRALEGVLGFEDFLTRVEGDRLRRMVKTPGRRGRDLRNGGNPMAMTQEQLEIRAAEQRRFDAMVRGDLEALGELLSEDLTYVHTSAAFETKADFMRRLRTGDLKYEAMDPESQEVRVYGSTGVVTGVARAQVLSGGRPLSFRMRYTDVYVKRGNRWQMVAWQATRLPQE